MAASTGTDAAAPLGVDASALLDSLDEAVVAVDLGDRIVAWNPAAERLFGIPAAAALGAARRLIEPADDPETWTVGVLDGRPRRFRGRRADGRGGPLVLDITASPITDPAGRVTGMVQIFRPTLPEEHSPLIEFAEIMARIGHWRIELPGDRHVWSDEVYRIHGLTPGQPPPDSPSVLALYHPEDRDRVEGAIREAILSGGEIAFEAKVVWPSGEVRQVIGRGTTERGADDRVTAVVGVLQDLTEQLARDAALVERDRSLRILREAIDIVPYAVSVYDEADRFVLANRPYFTLYPYLENEAKLRGLTFEEVLRISLRKRVVVDRRAVDDPDGYVRDRLADRRGGRAMPERLLSNGRWYLIRENRTPSGYTISTRIDITDRKQVEIELAATTAILQATLDTMPNALVAFDSGNRLVASNRAFAELLGIEPDRVARGRAIFSLVREALRRTPSLVVSFKAMVRRLIGQVAGDIEWQREDGDIFAVLGRPMLGGGYLALFRNVTAERLAQARAAEFEELLGDALEAMSEGFALFDADDVLVRCNETYRRIYGESSAFIQPGRRFEDMVRDAVAAGQFPAAIGREEEWVAGRLDLHRTPPEQPVLQTLSDGRVLMVAEYRTRSGGHVGIRADVTDRVRTENELRAARDELEDQARSLRDLAEEIDAARLRAEEAGTAKSRFLAMMSHELRTPMTGLLGMIELVSRTRLDVEQRGFVSTMRESAETLLALLNDILDFSKLEAGKVQIEEIVFAPERVTREVIGLFQAQASAKGLVLEAEFDASLPTWVRGDPLRVKQIVSNLISNGIKFTASGRVSVRLRASDEPNDTVRLAGEVIDTGRGIDPLIQRNLFQAFEQGDTSTTRRFGGTGLGLAISRRLAEGMGGGIEVESRLGEGSTFRFSVSVRRASAPPAVEPEPSETPDGPSPPMRVLLAEDNDVNRMLVSRVLAQSGHHVDEAGDGREALQAAMRTDYDVILMDMQMPVMDGMEATRAIRALSGPAASVPIIALTADAMPDHRQTYLDAGIDELLTKPIDWGLLSRTLRRVRGGRQARRKVEIPPPPVVSSFDSLPLFDRVRVDVGLGVLPPARVAGMLAMLPSEMLRLVEDYRAALRTGDLEAARRSTHALKGMAANFGALRLEAVARAAEAASASRGSADLVAPLLAEVVERTATAAMELSASFLARG